ncbi:Fic family protein [[Mycoplasma] testudinis]|uniref:Fic family protein n=1 Tax=[Mycoplasma] testudinis TaxID=33924 RepID=UPI000487D77E|nr:Fic family protein [[Mycoplasma] testudinis]
MPNLDRVKITLKILMDISEIEFFRGKWQSGVNLPSEIVLNQLIRFATIESIGSSNRIEGNVLSDEQVDEIFDQIEINSFRNRDEQEVAGYANIIKKIYDSYEDTPFSENFIKSFHKELMIFSDKDQYHKGNYKTVSNHVVSTKDGEIQGIIFQTATPFDTPFMMEKLVQWTNENLEKKVHPLIIIGIFIVHFLAIHPFADGNGRLSRLLTTFLMLKCGYSYVKCSSLESIIEANKIEFYKSIRATQMSIWNEAEVNYEPWLSFFINCLVIQKRRLEQKLKNLPKQDDAMKLTEKASHILSLFKPKVSLSVKQILELQTLQIKYDALRKILSNLVKHGYILKKGTTKSTKYSLKS